MSHRMARKAIPRGRPDDESRSCPCLRQRWQISASARQQSCRAKHKLRAYPTLQSEAIIVGHALSHAAGTPAGVPAADGAPGIAKSPERSGDALARRHTPIVGFRESLGTPHFVVPGLPAAAPFLETDRTARKRVLGSRLTRLCGKITVSAFHANSIVPGLPAAPPFLEPDRPTGIWILRQALSRPGGDIALVFLFMRIERSHVSHSAHPGPRALSPSAWLDGDIAGCQRATGRLRKSLRATENPAFG